MLAPSGPSQVVRAVGCTQRRPCLCSSNWSTMEGLTPGRTNSTLQGLTLKPGALGISIVQTRPPTVSRASSTKTRLPALARNAAQVRPLWPPPTTTTSYVFACVFAPTSATYRPQRAAVATNQGEVFHGPTVGFRLVRYCANNVETRSSTRARPRIGCVALRDCARAERSRAGLRYRGPQRNRQVVP